MRPALLLAALLLAGCSAPADDALGGDAPAIEHDLTDGSVGNGAFVVPDDGRRRIVELWFAATDMTKDVCVAEQPAAIIVYAPDGTLFADLRIDSGPDGVPCPLTKTDAQVIPAGDWTIEVLGRGQMVARVRVHGE